ncbi:MAG TPA: hypothetical protein DCY94_01765, partial [Firmicutes bacterium]|nr:hypothetical protein [Bacillota bacterium]
MKKETYIRITSGTLAILMFIGGYVLKKTPEPNENFVAYENQTTTLPKDKDIKIDDTKELDEYLGYSHVTLEDVYEAIDANDNLSIEESNLTKHLAHGILEKYPNYDLRVYYENIKRGLFFEVLTKEEYDEKYPNCGIAHFNAKDRRISIIEGADDKTKYHELGHATWSFDWDIDGVRLRREENIDSFIEAMNNRLIEAVTDDKSYSAESASLDILSAFVPSFTIQEYSKTGLTNLIDNLIVEFGGKANIVLSHIQEITYKNRYGNSNISLKDHPVLIDELF